MTRPPRSVLPKALRRNGKRRLFFEALGTGIGFGKPGTPRRWR